jgi:hypothetical protein
MMGEIQHVDGVDVIRAHAPPPPVMLFSLVQMTRRK